MRETFIYTFNGVLFYVILLEIKIINVEIYLVFLDSSKKNSNLLGYNSVFLFVYLFIFYFM